MTFLRNVSQIDQRGCAKPLHVITGYRHRSREPMAHMLILALIHDVDALPFVQAPSLVHCEYAMPQAKRTWRPALYLYRISRNMGTTSMTRPLTFRVLPSSLRRADHDRTIICPTDSQVCLYNVITSFSWLTFAIGLIRSDHYAAQTC
jgi:hypothetical protein